MPLNQENIESIARDENMREEPQILRKGLQMPIMSVFVESLVPSQMYDSIVIL